MVTELIKTAPSSSRSTPGTRTGDLQLGGDWMAFGTVGSPPNVADLDRGRRIGNRDDYQNLLRLAQSLNSDPLPVGLSGRAGRHPSRRPPPAREHDALTLMDKAIHCYSLGRQRNIDVLEMVRIARGVDEATLDREPSVFTVVNSSSPLRLDAPMSQGVMEFAERNQVVCITPFTLAGAMAPVTLAGALVEQNAEALAGMVLTQAVRPGRAGHLRRLHLERRHAVGRAGVRDAGGHADVDDRRPAGPSLRRAVSVVQRQRRQRARCAGGVRVGLLAVGRDPGRRQPADARRRLDGGRPPRELREDDPRRRAARDGRGVPRAGRRRRGHAGLRRRSQEVGPGGHFFGAEHTQSRYKTAFHKPMLSDWRNYETWQEAGSPELPSKANRVWKELLAAYEPPPMDPAIREELDAFVARRVAEGGVPTDY